MNQVLQRRWYLIGLVIVCGLLILGRLQSVFILPKVRVSLHELVMGMMILGALPHIRSNLKHLRTNKLIQYLAISLLIIAGSLIKPVLEGESILIGLFYFGRALLYFGWMLSLIVYIKKSIFSREIVLRSILFVSCGIAILGLFQYIFISDLRFLFQYGWDDHLNRLVSTLLDPPFTASVIGSGLLLFFVETKLRFISTKLNTLIIAILGTSILLTISRATILAFIVAFLIWMARRGVSITNLRPVVLGGGILGICIIGILLFRSEGEGAQLLRTESIIARIRHTSEQLSTIQGIEILLGQGWYLSQQHRVNFSDSSMPSHTSGADNLFVQLYVSTGIIGLVLLSYFGVRAAIELYRHGSQGTSYTLLFILLASQFNAIMLYPWILWILSTLMAIDISNNLEKGKKTSSAQIEQYE